MLLHGAWLPHRRGRRVARAAGGVRPGRRLPRRQPRGGPDLGDDHVVHHHDEPDHHDAPADDHHAAAAPPPATHHPVDPNGAPFAGVGGVSLVAPSHAVERVGFHQSADSGAQELTVLPGAVLPVDMNTRNRGTGAQTAADTVVQPGTTVYSPVSGTVVKSGAYQLYCSYADDMVEVDPDGHPGWRVTILHLEGVVVTPGMHLVAGITPIAGQAHQLPFSSQVDKYSPVKPAWPHVHVEVDDPTIPDTPSKGDSCCL